MIILDEESPFERIMKASRDHIQASETEHDIQEICNAIGERRIRDLVDILGRIEEKDGWHMATEYLGDSSSKKYPVPVGQEGPRKSLEPLKFREVIFDLFDCTGLEPISLSIDDLIAEISNAGSYVAARTKFKDTVQKAVYESLANGDILFFDSEFLYVNDLDTIAKKIELAQSKAITNTRLFASNGVVNIVPLWYSEYGRRVLAEFGICNSTIERESIEMVISVLQVSNETKRSLLQSLESTTAKHIDTQIKPMNPLYKDLLDSIISCDSERLRALGSRHACPTFNHNLRNYVDQYRSTGSSSDYRNLLFSLRDHVSIRWNDSIMVIAELSQISDERVTSDLINALGNFYHEPSVSTLLDIFCKTKKRQIRNLILGTITHLSTRCPEAQRAVHQAMNQKCPYLDEIQRFYHKTWKK